MYQIEDGDRPSRLGRYELLEKLDSGGMGAIYLARLAGEGGFEKLVVLKVLLPELAESERFVDMFLDEARIAARLSHPNICEIYELGSAAGRHFIAMQYLRGVPLGEAMKRPEGADPAEHARLVASLVAQAAEGLHHAHELRGGEGQPLAVVHRDVSPPNLFVTVDGVVKVLDFGIAKARDVESKTRGDEIKGKQSYMSPEQLVGEPLDRRSDVFSLGVVLYEGITQSRLFARSTDYLIARAILEEPIADPREREPAIGAPLAEATMRALARDRGDRYPSARDMGEALAAALAPLGGPVSPARIGEQIAGRFASRLGEREESYRRATILAKKRALAGATEIDTGAETRRTRRRRWLPRAAVAGLVAAAAAAVVLLGLGRSGPEIEPDAGVAEASRSDGAIQATWVPLAGDGGAERDGDGTGTGTGSGDGTGSETGDGREAGDGDGTGDGGGGGEGSGTEVRGGGPEGGERRPAARRSGFLSIDSTPYAVIYIDGRRAGVTPLIREKVRAGKRRVRAVLESGQSRRFTVVIEPGKLAPPRHLRW